MLGRAIIVKAVIDGEWDYFYSFLLSYKWDNFDLNCSQSEKRAVLDCTYRVKIDGENSYTSSYA